MNAPKSPSAPLHSCHLRPIAFICVCASYVTDPPHRRRRDGDNRGAPKALQGHASHSTAITRTCIQPGRDCRRIHARSGLLAWRRAAALPPSTFTAARPAPGRAADPWRRDRTMLQRGPSAAPVELPGRTDRGFARPTVFDPAYIPARNAAPERTGRDRLLSRERCSTGGHDVAVPLVKGFFDKRTFSVQYVVADPQTGSCAIIDPVLDFDPNAGATATWSADALLAHVREQGLPAGVDPRHASACRSPVRRRLPEGQDRCADRDRRPGRRGAEAVEGHLQPSRHVPDRRITVGPAVRRRRCVPHRRCGCEGDAVAGPHAGLADLRHRRRGLHPRHAVHARLRFGARRLSRRRRRHAVAEHPAHSGAAGSDAAVHRPRLHAGRAGATVGKHGRRAEGAEQASAAGVRRGGLCGDAQAVGQRPAAAAVAAARIAGEHHGRPAAGTREQRQALPEVAARRVSQGGSGVSGM